MKLPPSLPASRLWLALQLGSILLSLFAAIFLAGSGVNSQTTYGLTSGFHGSMLFTLSLPVSRRRLLFVRAGLGAIQTSVLVAILAGLTLVQRPIATTAPEALTYVMRAIICTMAVYALSVLLACLLDEMWQFSGGCLFWMAVFILQVRFVGVARISPLRGMESDLLSDLGAAPVAAYCGVLGSSFRPAVHVGAGASTKRILISSAWLAVTERTVSSS